MKTVLGQVLYHCHNELDFTIPELEAAIAVHKSGCDGEPSVYVCTYAKYNEGSLRGLWIDLTAFDDYDELINFCMAIYADEYDPELMAQDYEYFPAVFILYFFLFLQ